MLSCQNVYLTKTLLCHLKLYVSVSKLKKNNPLKFQELLGTLKEELLAAKANKVHLSQPKKEKKLFSRK